MVCGLSFISWSLPEPDRFVDLVDEPSDLPFWPDDDTAMRTVRSGTTGVLISGPASFPIPVEIACCCCCDFLSSVLSRLSPLFLWVEVERDRRTPCWRDPIPGVPLNLTTLFRGAGLFSRLRAGDEALGDGRLALAVRTCRRASRNLILSRRGSSFSPDANAAGTTSAASLMLICEDGRAGGDDGRRLAATVALAGASEACPSPSSALVKALNTIGTGISSSELSFKVENCWGCDLRSDPAPTAFPNAPAELDSLRLSADLDCGLRRACRADVLLPSEVK
jgi:hypothetical protein